jgi:hypothetical protein
VLQRKACCGACDSFEREADQVADQAVRIGEAQLAGDVAAPARVQRASCQDDDLPGVQTKRAGSAESNTQLDTSSAMRVARAGGAPLPEAVRKYFEPRFGRDFSQVRVHADGEAAAAARSVQARAYTLGQHIAFGAGEYAPSTDSGRRLLAHELVHVMQQESAPALLQRKVDCNLEPITKECGSAGATCMTVKDYCSGKYPKPEDIAKLHTDAVNGASSYKSKFPSAADNLLHFLDGSGTEKVMKADIFRDHPKTQAQMDVHLAKFMEGAKKRYDNGTLRIGKPGVEMVWTDTANAFSFDYNDLGLAVGGYTLCSKVVATARDPKEVGGNPAMLWVQFDPWNVQAFDCYNWDPGKGIGLAFATDNDLCCLENAARAKHFTVRSQPWTYLAQVQAVDITPAAPKAPPPPAKESKSEDDSR